MINRRSIPEAVRDLIHNRKDHSTATVGETAVRFQVERADRGVGIMSEGFAAWEEGGRAWCNMLQLEASLRDTRFEWFDEDSEAVDPPTNASSIEEALHNFANEFYEYLGND